MEHYDVIVVGAGPAGNTAAYTLAKAGAELRDALAVRTLANEKNKPLHLSAEGKSGLWEATADCVVGADGANGIVARTMGLRRDRALAIAIEAEVPHAWGDGHADL